MLGDLVALFQLLVAAHTQGKRGDLLKVAFFRKEQVHRVIRHSLHGLFFGNFLRVQNMAAARLAVLLRDFIQLAHNNRLNARF